MGNAVIFGTVWKEFPFVMGESITTIGTAEVSHGKAARKKQAELYLGCIESWFWSNGQGLNKRTAPRGKKFIPGVGKGERPPRSGWRQGGFFSRGADHGNNKLFFAGDLDFERYAFGKTIEV